MIAVADAYASMTMNALYRDILNEDEVVQAFKQHSGTQFDEHIAKTFVEKVLGKPWD